MYGVLTVKIVPNIVIFGVQISVVFFKGNHLGWQVKLNIRKTDEKFFGLLHIVCYYFSKLGQLVIYKFISDILNTFLHVIVICFSLLGKT